MNRDEHITFLFMAMCNFILRNIHINIMDRDYYILGLFLAMMKEIQERFARGQRLNEAEKMVAMMFMARVFQSFKRICARESIDSQSIFHHAQQDLLRVMHTGDTNSQRHLGDGTQDRPKMEP